MYLYFSVYTQSSLLDFWSGMVPSPSLYSDRWTVSALPKHSLVVKTMAATVPSEPGKIALTARKKNHGPFQGWKLELENGWCFLRWRINLGVFFWDLGMVGWWGHTKLDIFFFCNNHGSGQRACLEDEFRQFCLHKKPFFTATFLGGCIDSGRMHERNNPEN